MEEYQGDWRRKAGLKSLEDRKKKYYAGVQTKKGMVRDGPFRTPERAREAQRKMQYYYWFVAKEAS